VWTFWDGECGQFGLVLESLGRDVMFAVFAPGSGLGADGVHDGISTKV
jgi:hypothetical protein